MSGKCRPVFVSILLLGVLAGANGFAAEPGKVQVDSKKVMNWNDFADSLYTLHQHLLRKHEVKQEERTGGYPGMADFYHEVSYYDRTSNKLLSRVQFVKDQPELLHLIEIYHYDEQKRLARDYLAAYLPGGRNAPVQTLITLHGYNADLHGFRSFDASGELLSEQCRRNDASGDVLLILDIDELYAARRRGSTIMQSALYKKCFAGIPQQLSETHYPQSLLSAQ